MQQFRFVLCSYNALKYFLLAKVEDIFSYDKDENVSKSVGWSIGPRFQSRLKYLSMACYKHFGVPPRSVTVYLRM